MKHTVGLQEAHMVSLRSCDGKPIPRGSEVIIFSDTTERCPLCGDTLALVWDVRIIEVKDANA